MTARKRPDTLLRLHCRKHSGDVILPVLLVGAITAISVFILLSFSLFFSTSAAQSGIPEPLDTDDLTVQYTLYPLAAGDDSTNGSLQYIRPAPVNDTTMLGSYNWTLRSGLPSPLTVTGNLSLSLLIENPANESINITFSLFSRNGQAAIGHFDLDPFEQRSAWDLVPSSASASMEDGTSESLSDEEKSILMEDSLVLSFLSTAPVNISYAEDGEYPGAALRFTANAPILTGGTFTPSGNTSETATDRFYPNMPDEQRAVILAGSLTGPFFDTDGGEPALRITVFNGSDRAVVRDYDLEYEWHNSSEQRSFRAVWHYPTDSEPGPYRVEWKLSDDIHSFFYQSRFNISAHGALVNVSPADTGTDENATWIDPWIAGFSRPATIPFTIRNIGSTADSYDLDITLSDGSWTAHILYVDLPVLPGDTLPGQILLIPPFPFDPGNMSSTVSVELTATSRNDPSESHIDTTTADIDPLDLLPDFSVESNSIITSGNITAGEPFTVQVPVRNLGGGIGNVTVLFRSGSPGDPDENDTVFTSVKLTLASNESQIVKATYPGIIADRIRLSVELDALLDGNGGNNRAVTTVALPLADFMIDDGDIEFTAGSFVENENITITATVWNTGDANGTARVFMYSITTTPEHSGARRSGIGEDEEDRSGQVLLHHRPISIVAGGSVVVSITASFTEGDYLISIEIEFGVPEIDVTDNRASAALYIDPAADTTTPDDKGTSPIIIGAALVGGTAFGAIIVLGMVNETARFRLLSLFMAVPLYSRIRKEDMLANETRQRLMSHISGNPGVHFRQLMVEMGLKNGTLTHHLRTLERGHYIRTRRDGMYLRFYSRDNPPDENLRPHRSPEDINAQIVTVLREEPGLSQVELAHRIGESRQRINNYIKRLTSGGIIMLRREGRVTRCYLAGTSSNPASVTNTSSSSSKSSTSSVTGHEHTSTDQGSTGNATGSEENQPKNNTTPDDTDETEQVGRISGSR